MTITTAARFSDEMNARRVLRERANDEEHAEMLTLMLRLDLDEIQRRHALGARATRDDDGRLLVIDFVDGSLAVRDQITMRWSTL